MREMDTESPVVWPAWCYSGETGGEGDTITTQPVSLATPTGTGGAVKPRGKRRNVNVVEANKMNGDFNHHQQQQQRLAGSPHHNNNNNNTNNNNNGGSVKHERLSPAGTPDNTSSRSRSVTPSSSSVPGTPPGLEHARNYSDFMRSLAAKYNNANPNEYFNSSIRNGLLDPRFAAAFKPGSPFTGIMTPMTSSKIPPPTISVPKEEPPSVKKQQHAEFIPSNLPMFPPMIDMSCTRALLAMVRQAKEDESNNYAKSGSKRSSSTDAISSPLDLSSAGGMPSLKKSRPAKSIKRGGSESPGPPQSSSSSACGTPVSLTATLPITSAKQQPCSVTTPRPCVGQCLDTEINAWSVEEVANFVAGIDICAEYAQNFRDQRIDGTGLLLLTEEHLTTVMNMKLGPVLKMKSMLSRKLGSCAVCLHCAHCHSPPTLAEENNSNSPTPSQQGSSRQFNMS